MPLPIAMMIQSPGPDPRFEDIKKGVMGKERNRMRRAPHCILTFFRKMRCILSMISSKSSLTCKSVFGIQCHEKLSKYYSDSRRDRLWIIFPWNSLMSALNMVPATGVGSGMEVKSPNLGVMSPQQQKLSLVLQ